MPIAFHCRLLDFACGIVLFEPLTFPLIWSAVHSDAATWIGQLRDRIERHEKGTPQFRLGLWRAWSSAPGFKENFESPEETTWAYNLLGSEKIVVDRACSKSYIAVLPDDEKEAVKNDVKAILSRGDGLVWSDKEKGEFDYPYKTYAVIARKKH